MKSEKSKSCLVNRDPPRVELDTVSGCQPNVFNIQPARMPVAVEAAGIVWEENQARFEHPDKPQDQEVGDKNCEQEAQETSPEGFLGGIRDFPWGDARIVSDGWKVNAVATWAVSAFTGI